MHTYTQYMCEHIWKYNLMNLFTIACIHDFKAYDLLNI